MALHKVAKQVVDAVFERLSDTTAGFNQGIADNAPNYDIDSDFVVLDFGEGSSNFFFAQIEPDSFRESGYLTFPCAFLYVLETGNTNDEKFHQFSGVIRCVFEVFLSFPQIRGLRDFEAYGHCIEDVVIDIMNREENQLWGKPLVYNGQIQCKRGPVVYGAENFTQRIGFSLIFGLHQ